MPLWIYAILAVVVPAAWGVAMYKLFSVVDQRHAEKRKQALPPIDYSI
jgi:hypothetical protein